MAFVGLMLRVANVLGLHRDPSHFGSDITPIEAETRRRVWWQVVHVDVLVAMAAGVPPLIELNSWDVKGISELKEEFIGTEVGTRYEMAVKSGQRRHDAVEDPLGDPSYRSMVSTASIMAAGKLRYSRKECPSPSYFLRLIDCSGSSSNIRSAVLEQSSYNF